MSARVLIVDDHKLFSEGLTKLLKDRFEVVGTIGDGTLLADAVLRLRPDVVLLDLSMPQLGGLEALRHIKARHIDCRVIVLTMHGDARLAVEALRAGAAGFLLKESSGDELLTAIDAVLQGRSYLTSTLTRHVIALMSAPAEPGKRQLTPRQRDVLHLVVQGKRAKEIADLLNLSQRSVESVKYQLMQELNVHSTAELVRYAIQNELVVL